MARRRPLINTTQHRLLLERDPWVPSPVPPAPAQMMVIEVTLDTRVGRYEIDRHAFDLRTAGQPYLKTHDTYRDPDTFAQGFLETSTELFDSLRWVLLPFQG